jgi:hypothetical protein
MDDIGLGEFLANIVFATLGVIALIGYSLFFYFNRKLAGFIWVSVMANIFSFLYFMGSLQTVVIVFSMFVWPLINVALIIFAFMRRNKTVKKM